MKFQGVRSLPARQSGNASALLGRQLHDHADNLRASIVANAVNTLVCAAVFSNSLPFWVILIGANVMAVLLARRYVVNQKTSSATTNNALRQIDHQIRLNAGSLGAFWGTLIAFLLSVATPGQQLFVGILGAGMMSAGSITYRTLPGAARWFVGMCALGSFLGLISVGTWPAYAAIGLLACYMGVLFVSISTSFKNFAIGVERELALAESADTIRLLLNDYEEQGSDWLFAIDSEGDIIDPCERFAEAARRPRQTLAGKCLFDLLDNDADTARLRDRIQAGAGFREMPVAVPLEGDVRWWSISARPTAHGVLRGVITDITAQRHAEQKVSYMAHHDGLTDLPNRFLFNETLYRALNRQSGQAGLLYLDLDHFKAINDTLGHPVGDHLLQSVARRLEECAEGKSDMVARLGGDEFAVLVSARDLSGIEVLADRIVEALNKPFSLDGHDVVIGCTIGIAVAPDHAQSAEKLLQYADLALYTAKNGGRNRWARFETGMDAAAQARRLLELDLRTSLGKDEMCLHYQPLVNVETGQVAGYEALLRWEHPTRGIVMPNEFVPIAEDTGMIVQLGEWVIRHALEEASRWPDHLGIAVNLSPAQMRSPSLISTIISALARTGVAPARLELEITESVLMQDSEANLDTLHKLRSLGVRIALDDFGTGYSSLNYLRSFPFDKIKIDRCFVSEIDTREDCRAIIRSVVALANSLGMVTTAEGVEREAQMIQLREEGCVEVQGFLFSKAIPSAELTDLRGSRPTPITRADPASEPEPLRRAS
jgi:diguanylate cyclase (GGDEF)-like protein